MAAITIDLTDEEISQLKQITQTTDDATAASQAVRMFLRRFGLRELKAASGKVAFVDRAEELELLELGESDIFL